MSIHSGPRRPYGEAELLVEASFADLSHGGDGDLTKAYTLLEKVRRISNSYLLKDQMSQIKFFHL